MNDLGCQESSLCRMNRIGSKRQKTEYTNSAMSPIPESLLLPRLVDSEDSQAEDIADNIVHESVFRPCLAPRFTSTLKRTLCFDETDLAGGPEDLLQEDNPSLLQLVYFNERLGGQGIFEPNLSPKIASTKFHDEYTTSEILRSMEEQRLSRAARTSVVAEEERMASDVSVV